MKSEQGYGKLLFSIVRRYTSSKQQTAAARESVRSFFARFINDQKTRVRENDIRLQPYKSKHVYTETGAIRPVSF
jgi:hypothetical protein